MNSKLILVAMLLVSGLQQCSITRQIKKELEPDLYGLAGFEMKCHAMDTISSVMISKAAAQINSQGEQYEVLVTLYSKKDSVIYLSAVSNGFEIIRAGIDHDTIRVIDRLNRIVYRTPLKKRFGHQHPVSFKDLQNLVSAYFLCDDMLEAQDGSGTFFYFEFDEDPIRKRITMKEEDMMMEKFEFFHEITGKYLMGERTGMGFRIYSNFMIGQLEVIARGGTVTYNREVKVDLNVNRKRYTFKDLQ